MTKEELLQRLTDIEWVLNILRNGQKFNTKIYPTPKKYYVDDKLIYWMGTSDW